MPVDTLYVGWQDRESRRWYPVGRLNTGSDRYEFEYLRGAVEARRDADFRGIAQFPDFERTYRSSELFSFFENRVISASRPDAADDMERLGLSTDEGEPRAFDILSRSYGRRTTDRFEIYPPPIVDAGRIELVFFTRGVRHLDDAARDRWQTEQAPAEPIRFVHEPENPVDPNALLVVEGDDVKMGYLPWYYTASFAQLVRRDVSYDLRVRRHNPEPAYPQHRFLMEFTADRPTNWSFPQSELYDPVDPGTSSTPTETDAA